MTVETAEGWALAPDIAWARTADGQAAVMTLEAGQPLLLSASGHVIWDVSGVLRPPQHLWKVSTSRAEMTCLELCSQWSSPQSLIQLVPLGRGCGQR